MIPDDQQPPNLQVLGLVEFMVGTLTDMTL